MYRGFGILRECIEDLAVHVQKTSFLYIKSVPGRGVGSLWDKVHQETPPGTMVF